MPADRHDDVGRCSCRLPWTAARHAQFGVNSAHAMDRQDDLAGHIVDVGDDFLDDGRTVRFLKRASVVGALHTACLSPASVVKHCVETSSERGGGVRS
jgi:hypothetical protein